ncbi:alpha/beta hydrolase [Humidisolicoccus flavus]|uniref:alpha/beta hydrolase n=1 Tax=Humidisolicoccus flavus TaxID=3111414 RepID=UPI00324EC984
MKPSTRRMSLIGVAAIATLLLSACIPPPSFFSLPGSNSGSSGGSSGGGSSAGDGNSVYPHGPSGDFPSADVESFYTQDVDWQECLGSKICGTVEAPMDWFNPDDHEPITVSMVIRPADGERYGALLYNPGGPGGSGFEYISQYAEYLIPADVLEHYDVVGFDPRGVGESSPVSCYDDPEYFKDWLYDIPSGEQPEFLSDDWFEDAAAAGEEFGQQCLEHTGDLLGFVGTEQAASDMDLIRALVGEEQLNYLGVSYGTLLGATYAELFTDKVGRFVLDAAVAPTTTDSEMSLFQAKGFEGALTAYLESCLNGSKCPFDGSVEDASKDVRALLDEVAEKPLKVADGRQLGSSTLFTAIAYNLYSSSSWSTLSEVFQTVMDGSGEFAMQNADQYNGLNPDGTFADNSSEAFMAINCLDYPAERSRDQVRQDAEELQEVAPIFGQDFAGGGICGSWPFESTREPHEINAPGANQIIVIGGTNDPATPYEWSVKTADMLDSGVLITVEAEGHGQYNSGNACVDQPVTDYFLNGTELSGDLDC